MTSSKGEPPRLGSLHALLGKKTVENHRREVLRDLAWRLTVWTVPLHRPIERSEKQHPHHREVEISSEATARHRLAQETRPEGAVLPLPLQVPLANRLGELRENAEIRRRVVALRENRRQMRGDRGAKLGDRVRVAVERLNGFPRGGEGGGEPHANDLFDERLLGIEVVVEAPGLHLRAGGNSAEIDAGITELAETRRRSVEDALSRA